METKPKIVLFQCQWCLYSEADQNWVDHDLPINVHLAKVPCTGRINPLFVLNAVQGGADGIVVSGCLPEQCHFKEGNLSARRQMDEFFNLFDYIGYEKSRMHFIWLDLQDRGHIQRELIDFEAKLSELGPTVALATRVPAPTEGQHD
ncbi:MAG: hydrogenase iron-sulfur subunit [Anaerolineaceae bacterium]